MTLSHCLHYCSNKKALCDVLEMPDLILSVYFEIQML